MAMLTETHTARKHHGPCSCCGRVIRPDDLYMRLAATPDDPLMASGRWRHLKAHAPYGSCLTNGDTDGQ